MLSKKLFDQIVQDALNDPWGLKKLKKKRTYWEIVHTKKKPSKKKGGRRK